MTKRDKRIQEDAANLEAESPFVEAVEMELQDSIDLHTFQPREIASVVEEYLQQCLKIGFSEARLIHGKGTGTLRTTVHALLRRLPVVETFRSGDETSGSWGATWVTLKR